MAARSKVRSFYKLLHFAIQKWFKILSQVVYWYLCLNPFAAFQLSVWHFLFNLFTNQCIWFKWADVILYFTSVGFITLSFMFLRLFHEIIFVCVCVCARARERERERERIGDMSVLALFLVCAVVFPLYKICVVLTLTFSWYMQCTSVWRVVFGSLMEHICCYVWLILLLLLLLWLVCICCCCYWCHYCYTANQQMHTLRITVMF
jgi:hypothetical protein